MSAAPHKAGPRVDPANWEMELRQFFKWLEGQIVRSDNRTHELVGNKNIRRKITRACRQFTIRMEKIFPHAPGLHGSIVYILDLVRELSTSTGGSVVVESPIGNMRLWRDQIGKKQSMSADLDRRARERENELLIVARIVAPVLGAKGRFDSIKEDLSRKRSCAVRSIDEALRRTRREIEKGGGLTALLEKYFEEFKLEKFYRAHPKQMYVYPPMKKGKKAKKAKKLRKHERITSLTDSEIDSILRLCQTPVRSRSRR